MGLNSIGGILRTFERFRVGNAQIIGRREFQSNYFATLPGGPGRLFAVLSDGSIDHQNGRRASELAAGFCIAEYGRHGMGGDGALFLKETAMKANRYVRDMIYVDKSPYLSLSMAMLDGREMHYFNVGANIICLYNGHSERIIGGGADSPYHSGKCGLAPGNIVGLFSSGAYAGAHPMERIRIVGSKKNVFDKAQGIVESVSGKNLADQTNATALLVEVMK